MGVWEACVVKCVLDFAGRVVVLRLEGVASVPFALGVRVRRKLMSLEFGCVGKLRSGWVANGSIVRRSVSQGVKGIGGRSPERR